MRSLFRFNKHLTYLMPVSLQSGAVLKTGYIPLGQLMLLKIAADVIVLVHLMFIIFVVTGGLFVLKWPKTVWLHIPAAIWGAMIEFAGWMCPLTPVENTLRAAGGKAVYQSGFINHYVIPVIYPAGLTREIQFVMGCIVIVLNVLIYGVLIVKKSGKNKIS